MKRFKKHKKAKELVNSFYEQDSHCLVIHYSCESFYNIKDGRTPRITSIAVRYLTSAQTKSFSIHKIAEIKGVDFNQIDINYDDLEKEMLKEFFEFAKRHSSFKWIHWNMRDINYGFEAIQYRGTVLGIRKPFEVSDDNKFDLARILIDIYGEKYADHPRLVSILYQNRISPKNWLNGDEEAIAFDNKEFVKLHQSTLAKVNVFENIIKLTAESQLKTKAKLRDIYGISPQGIHEQIKDYWFYSMIIFFISIFLGIYLGKLFS
ncbi:hypothetical protein [Sphingobacterium mizutaii]|uniref:hypothetical protein n=1 Tax=Sphingobacterium mizutaii TaxID=1010 RepID=UPI001BE46001|nr:hypothetical protein [Sphingobacterium mizutaii]